MTLSIEQQRAIAWRIAEGVASEECKFLRAVGEQWIDAYLISWAQFDDCYEMLLESQTFWSGSRLRTIKGRG